MSLRKKETSTDRLLVEACIRNDLVAWATLVTKYSTLMTLTIANRLHRCGITLPRQDIDDIRQQVLTDIWGKGALAALRGRDDISGWIAIVCANAAVAHVRRKKNSEPRHHLPLETVTDDPVFAPFVQANVAGAPCELHRRECAEKIAAAIERLPDRERLVIKLHLLHGQKFNDIARILSMPPGTVASDVKRAKERMQRMLREIDPRQ